MRVREFVMAVGLVVALTGCGDDDGESPEVVGAPSAEASAEGGGATGSALQVVVGSASDPEAFEISLQDASGTPVTSLPAGDYEVAVRDQSTKHNAHLSGSGVDERTGVPDKQDATWSVSLQAGEYTLVCDPHPRMRVELTVT